VSRALREYALSLPQATEDFPWGDGELVTSGERITLRRLGSSAVFVGSLIILRDGHPDTTTIAGRSFQRPIVVAPGGLWTFEVEREDKKP
jgi:hypothetical protein